MEFWLLRMALETAIHRWDADRATGEPGVLGASLAACGIDEFARLQIPKLENAEFGSTGRVLLESEDRPARWLVTFLPREVQMFRADEGVGAEGVVSGTVSDLYLTLLGRGDSRKLRQSGDPEVLRSITEAISMIPDAKR